MRKGFMEEYYEYRYYNDIIAGEKSINMRNNEKTYTCACCMLLLLVDSQTRTRPSFRKTIFPMIRRHSSLHLWRNHIKVVHENAMTIIVLGLDDRRRDSHYGISHIVMRGEGDKGLSWCM